MATPGQSTERRLAAILAAGMGRRDLVRLMGCVALSWPLEASAQQPTKVWRIGFLGGASRPASFDVAPWSGFLQGMRELGYVERKNFIMEWRFADGRYEHFPELAAELVRLNVDVIVVPPSVALRVVQRATIAIPIVAANASDPVGQGLVASLARPGGNITGLVTSTDDTSPKQLQLLSMVVPNLARIGLLVNPDNQSTTAKAIQVAARRVDLTLLTTHARDPQDIERAFTTFSQERVEAIIAPPDAFMFQQRRLLAELALGARLPSLFFQRDYVEVGGLMSYGESLKDFYYRAASYVDKIFKGAKPADLPMEQPTRFFLVINIKTAKQLGLGISPALLSLADEVIE